MCVPKLNCHPDRSVAQWRDLLFLFGPRTTALGLLLQQVPALIPELTRLPKPLLDPYPPKNLSIVSITRRANEQRKDEMTKK